MKIIICFFFVFVSHVFVFSQSEKLNWLILINEKIPESTLLNGEFICFADSTQKIIPFNYTIGNIKLHKEDLEYITKIANSLTHVIVKLTYQEFDRNSYKTYLYSFKVPILLFFDYYNEYVVVEIKNINKRKRTFFVILSTPNLLTQRESNLIRRMYIETNEQKLGKGMKHNEIIRMKQIDL